MAGNLRCRPLQFQGFGILQRYQQASRGAPGIARRPSQPKISDFIGDQRGVDELSTSTITMLHKQDTVTLINSYEDTVANFQMKIVSKVAQETLWWTTAEKTTEKIDNFSLATGASKTITLDEGTLQHYGVGKLTKNVDIFIELISVDGWDISGEEETTYVAPGVTAFGPGGYWTPRNIASRVRGRRRFLGSMSNGRDRRKGLLDMIQEGKVYKPKQAVMIYGAETIEDASERFDLGLRPY